MHASVEMTTAFSPLRRAFPAPGNSLPRGLVWGMPVGRYAAMPTPPLPTLHVWHDTSPRHAEENMAVDEAMLLAAVDTGHCLARFYAWDGPAYTVGYFHDFAKRPLDDLEPRPVRRLTGGGLVEHGSDITFTLAVSGDTDFVKRTGPERYRAVHQCLVDAFGCLDVPLILEEDDTRGDNRCFARAVRWDVVDPRTGAKVAGGAQRRTRGGILHQGSVRPPPAHAEIEADWTIRFCFRLAFDVYRLFEEETEKIIEAGRRLVREKYGTAGWNEGRPR